MKSYSLMADIVTVVAPVTVDTEFEVTHSLSRVPQAAFLLQLDQAAQVYKGPTAWTSTIIYLRASVARTGMKLLIM